MKRPRYVGSNGEAYGVAVYETAIGWRWTAYSQHGSEYGKAGNAEQAWKAACEAVERLKDGP